MTSATDVAGPAQAMCGMCNVVAFRLVAAWLSCLALVAVTGCSSNGGGGGPGVGGAGGQGGAAGATGGAVGPSMPAVKVPIAGLIDMQNIAWHNGDGGQPTFTMTHVQQFPGLFGGIVVNATWSAIQPSATGPLDFSAIDAALAQIRTYNAANPSAPLGVKLRVYAGTSTPDWAKQLDGNPLALQRNPQGCAASASPCPITVGLYWTADFIAAWRALQAALAARYDTEPLIRQVAVTSCAPQTDEPFVPSVGDANHAALLAAGYTDAAEQACLMGAIDDYAAWTYTLVDYTFNVFGSVSGGADPAFTLSVMTACRARLGARCVLDNHALSAPLRAADMQVYEQIQTLGPPANFQTESPQGDGCQWIAPIAEGISLGAEAIEVWTDSKFQGTDSLAAEDMILLASEFTTPIAVPAPNPQPTPCSGFQ